MMYPYCSIIIKFISKTKFEKVYLWNPLFFFVNHRDELTGRCINETKRWFLDRWVYFLGFPDILQEIRNKIHELGIHQTELGRVCLRQTQNSRKSMYITWVMNKSVCEGSLDEMRLWSTFIGHIKPSPEIWFETEHFEILSFQTSGSVSGLFTSWA